MNERPLLTFAIIAYNQERFIREAVRGALSQTYSPLEIIISDDHSCDNTVRQAQAEIQAYAGPHLVRLSCNPINMGFGAHLNRIMELARGEIIVIAAGDDVSTSDRTQRLYEAFVASGGRALALYSNAIVIDGDGRQAGRHLVAPESRTLTASWMARHRAGTLGCSQAWHRQVFDLFGPLGKNILFEDHVIPFRAALLGEVKYIDEALVLYRRHENNMHFREPIDVTKAQVNPLLQRHADGHIATFRQRLQDIDRVCALQPERRAELDVYRRNTEILLREAIDEKYLFQNTNAFKRLAVMGRALLHGTPPRRLARWVLTYFCPGLYLRYQILLRQRQVNRAAFKDNTP